MPLDAVAILLRRSATRPEHPRRKGLRGATDRPATVACALAIFLLLAVCAAVAVGPAARPAAAATPGRILFVRDGNLWLASQGAARQLTAGAVYRHPSWSPDGQTIAVAWLGEMHSDIATLDAAGRVQRRWTRNAASWSAMSWAFRPAVAPDGRRVAFISDLASFHLALWTVDLGNGALRRLTWDGGPRGAVGGASWAPDGRRLALVSGRDGSRQVWVFDAARNAWQRLTNHLAGAYDPAWSPDGRAIAYVAREDGMHDLWLVAPDGAGARRLTHGGLQRAPAWSPDSRRLAYVAYRDQNFDVWTAIVQDSGDSATLTNVEQITRGFAVDAAAGLAWGPDA